MMRSPDLHTVYSMFHKSSEGDHRDSSIVNDIVPYVNIAFSFNMPRYHTLKT